MIKKIYKWLLANIDKMLHFGVNYAVIITGGLYGTPAYLTALILIILASFGKEIWDQHMYQGWSWGDLIADGVGIVLASIVILISKLI